MFTRTWYKSRHFNKLKACNEMGEMVLSRGHMVQFKM